MKKKSLLQEMIGYSYDEMKCWLKSKTYKQGVPVWCHLYKRKLIIQNDITFEPNIKVGEDVLFNLQAYIKGKSILIIDYCGYYYVQRSDSALHKYVGKNDEYLLDNKIQLVKWRSKIAENTKQFNLKPMYAGNLVLSCIVIALDVFQIQTSLCEKVKRYNKYRYLKEVDEAVRNMSLKNISYKNRVILILVKNRADALLILLLTLAKKMRMI